MMRILLATMLVSGAAFADSVVISGSRTTVVISGQSRAPAVQYRVPLRSVATIRKTRTVETPRKVVTRTVEQIVQPSASSARVHMRWNIQGDWSPSMSQTRRHLEQEHGVSTAGMSHQQMLDLHDALHEGRRAPARSVSRVRVQQSNCPGGVCPSPAYGRRTIRSRGFFQWR